MKSNLFRAILLAPLSVVLGVALSIALIWLVDPEPAADRTLQDYFGNVVVGSAFAIPIAYVGVIVIGWPLHIALTKFGRTSSAWYIVPAIFVGAAFATYMANYNYLWWYILAVFCAATVASTERRALA